MNIVSRLFLYLLLMVTLFVIGCSSEAKFDLGGQ